MFPCRRTKIPQHDSLEQHTRPHLSPTQAAAARGESHRRVTRRSTRSRGGAACASGSRRGQPASASAQAIDVTPSHVNASPHLEILEDPSRELAIEDVRSAPVAARFRPSTSPTGANLGFSRSALWARLTIENPTSAPIERWLTANPIEFERLELHVDGEPMRVVGLATAQPEREMSRRWPAFRIALSPHSTVTLHLRATSAAENQLPVELWAPRKLIEFDAHVSLVVGVTHGILTALALYNLFLFQFLRDRSHLYYSLGVLFAEGWIACLDGTASLLLPASWVASHVQTVLCGAGACVCFTLFPRRFLDLPRAHPVVDRVLVGAMAAFVLLNAGWLLGAYSYYRLQIVSIPLVLILPIGLMLAGVLCMREGFAPAQYCAHRRIVNAHSEHGEHRFRAS